MIKDNVDLELLDKEYSLDVADKDKAIIHEDLVSVIMPSYNNGKWLKNAIHSALSQQGVNVELIVVDDGSTDDSVEIAQNIAKKHKNVNVISLLKNFGCYYARNVGISYAKGDYIIIHDSDDIAHPEMLLRQLNFIKQYPDKIACQCRMQRWDHSFRRPLTEPNYGENTLLWKKKILETSGWYDSVRYAGDTEFRCRLKKIFGDRCIARFDDVLYGARVVERSLTTSTASSAFKYRSGEGLKLELTESRQNYVKAFSSWHNNLPEKKEKILWPQFIRAFDLGATDQNASPSLGQRTIGSMASFPPRRYVLEKVLATILPQVDELRLYLNDYEEVPEFAIHPKIKATCGCNALGDLRDNGKFYHFPTDRNCYFFTFDDDILYPTDYVAKMVHFIEMFNRRCVVGVHGTIFPANFTSFGQRRVFSYGHMSPGRFVDMLGTGTTAWHSSCLDVSLDNFKSKGLCDLYFSAVATGQYIPLFTVPRSKGWLKKAQESGKDSIYIQTLDNPEPYFDVYRKYLLPVLSKKVRYMMEQQLVAAFDENAIAAAGLELMTEQPHANAPLIPTRRNFLDLSTICTVPLHRFETNSHFHVVVYGKNAVAKIDDCVRSVAMQSIGDYSYTLTIADVGSTDGTFEKLACMTILKNARLIRFGFDSTDAHVINSCIVAALKSDTVVVCVKMPTILPSCLFRHISNVVTEYPECALVLDRDVQSGSGFFAFRRSFYSKNISFCRKNVDIKQVLLAQCSDAQVKMLDINVSEISL